MSAADKFFESLNALQSEENNYQENFNAIKELNATEPESFGLQAFQNFAEIFAPHLISESLGKMFGEGSTVSSVVQKVAKGDFQGAIKESTDAVSSKVQETVQNTVDSVKQQAGQLSESVQSGERGLSDAVGDAVNQATEGVSRIASSVQNVAQSVGNTVEQSVQNLATQAIPEDITEAFGTGTFAQLAAASRSAGVEPLMRLGNVPEVPAGLGDALETTEMSPFEGVSQGLDSLSGAARSDFLDILNGRISTGENLTQSQFDAAMAQRGALVERAGLQEGESAINSFMEPIAAPGTTSNAIGRLLNQSQNLKQELPQVPEANVAEDVLQSNVSDTAEGIATGARNLASTAETNIDEAFAQAGTFARGVGEPMIAGTPQRFLGDPGRFLRPGPDEPLPGTSQVGEAVVQEGEEAVQGVASGLSGAAEGAVSGVARSLSGAAEGAVQQLTEASGAVSDAINAAKSGIGNIVKSALPGAGEDAVEEVAAGGEEGGPEGLLGGAVLALGSLLMGLLGHHSAPAPPPITLSQPIFSAGLSAA